MSLIAPLQSPQQHVVRMRGFQLLLTALAIIVGAARLNAGSATWGLNPTSNDWHTAANWTPETVPNGASDVATFDVSNVTDVTTSSDPGDYVFLDSIVFNSGASTYNITLYADILGAGVINNSGMIENIDSTPGLTFDGYATAGENVVYTNMEGGGRPTSITTVMPTVPLSSTRDTSTSGRHRAQPIARLSMSPQALRYSQTRPPLPRARSQLSPMLFWGLTPTQPPAPPHSSPMAGRSTLLKAPTADLREWS
jgi:hypothetical protein